MIQNDFMFQRHFVQNGTLMFITTNLQHRQKLFYHEPYAKEAIDTLYRTQHLHPFLLYGFVIMPDHCHLLLRVPEDESISRIMRQFKYGTSMNIGIGPIWQSRFHMKIVHEIRHVLRYIHMNPVKAGLVEEPQDYPWSSACGKWDVIEME